MADPTVESLRGLILSATELQDLTDWPDALIEDYLNLLDNFTTLAVTVDTKNNIIKTTTLVNSSPYSILATDEEIFFDTDAIPIIALLPAGIDGANYRMINVGTSQNDVTLTPDGTDLLFGVNTTERIADQEVIDATYETTEGWY